MKIRPPKFIKKLFPTFIWNFPDEKEGIFLTFDDGPFKYTGRLLDILDKYGVKAEGEEEGKSRKPAKSKPVDEEVTEWNEGGLGGVSIADLIGKNA